MIFWEGVEGLGLVADDAFRPEHSVQEENHSTEELVANIATTPPEKEEKMIVLSEEDKGTYTETLTSHVTVTDTFTMQRDIDSSPSATDGLSRWTAKDDSSPVTQVASQQYGLVLNADGIDATLQRAGSIAAEIAKVRLARRDIDDYQSALLRHIILKKSGGRVDILGLSMALRATRLQHATQLPPSFRHRLAMETLQLWAPLSFQIGVSSSLPELEVHSYVLLFPKSFNSFINWYTAFRPIAKKMLNNFQIALETALREDPVIPRLASKVLIQSRLKSPSSAFKKMVKSPSKQRDHLYDMLGVRVIISERAPDPMEAMVSSHFDLNVYDKNVDTEYVFDFDEVEMQDRRSNDFFNVDEHKKEIEAELEAKPEGVTRVPTTAIAEASSHEEDVVNFVSKIVRRLSEWEEDYTRFKNYIAKPKASGYQSMHMTMVHRDADISLEVQLRSARMHLEAEYGRASHANYKALILPASVDQGQ